VRIANDLFERGEWSADSAHSYFHSEAFFKSKSQIAVAARCFSLFDKSLVVKEVRNLFLGIKGNYHFLDDLGLWNETNKCFYSPLLHKHLFQLCCKQSDNTTQKLLLDQNQDWFEQVADVIATGFEHLDPTSTRRAGLRTKMRWVLRGGWKPSNESKIFF